MKPTDDLTGKKFGRLTAIEPIYENNIRKWRCKCECGNEKITTTSQLNAGYIKSCGCIHTTSLLGKVFGYLTVLEFDGYGVNDKPYWRCKCMCGKEISVLGVYLTGNKTTNCGCQTSRLLGNANSKPKGEAARNAIFASYKSNAKRKGRLFELSNDDMILLVNGNCYYCGCPPSSVKDTKKCNGQFIYNGIDRKDNNIGYTKDNCVSCCRTCNQLKKIYSHDDFLQKIEKIYNHRIKK